MLLPFSSAHQIHRLTSAEQQQQFGLTLLLAFLPSGKLEMLAQIERNFLLMLTPSDQRKSHHFLHYKALLYSPAHSFRVRQHQWFRLDQRILLFRRSFVTKYCNRKRHVPELRHQSRWGTFGSIRWQIRGETRHGRRRKRELKLQQRGLLLFRGWHGYKWIGYS